MIRFTDKRLYLKGTGRAILSNPQTGDIDYYSDKFSTSQIQTSVTMGEIRAGLGNPIASMIASDAGVSVNLEAEDFNFGVKAAQVGAAVTANAPVLSCVTGTVSETALAIPSGYIPIAGPGFSSVYAYAQAVGEESPIATDGVAYPVVSNVLSGFVADPTKTYKIWFWANRPNAKMATITTDMDAGIEHLYVEFAVWANDNGGANNTGTRAGTLFIVVPRMKFAANGNVDGSQTTNDKTAWSGQALPYDDDVVQLECPNCSSDGSVLAYYLYVPCDSSNAPVSIFIPGGSVSVAAGSSEMVKGYFFYADRTAALANNTTGVVFALDAATTGVTIDATTGIVTVAGGTATQDVAATVTATIGTDTLTDTFVISVQGA